MLKTSSQFFDEHFVHAYAGDTLELRTLARLLFDANYTIDTAWFDINFLPGSHSAAYTLFLRDSQQTAAQRLTVPSTLVAENFLFEGRTEPLASLDAEWRRAGFYLWMNCDELGYAHGADFVEAVLVDFLRQRARSTAHPDLEARLAEIPINAPHRDATTSTVMEALDELYTFTLELVEAIPNPALTKDEIATTGEQHILDIWADLTWYDPYSLLIDDEE